MRRLGGGQVPGACPYGGFFFLRGRNSHQAKCCPENNENDKNGCGHSAGPYCPVVAAAAKSRLQRLADAVAVSFVRF